MSDVSVPRSAGGAFARVVLAGAAFIGLPCLVGVAIALSHLPRGLDDNDVFALWLFGAGLAVTLTVGLLARAAVRRLER